MVAKIDNINSDVNLKQIDEIKLEISVIGEPFIKSKISEYFLSKLPENEQKITLEEELRKIKAREIEIKYQLSKRGSFK